MLCRRLGWAATTPVADTPTASPVPVGAGEQRELAPPTQLPPTPVARVADVAGHRAVVLPAAGADDDTIVLWISQPDFMFQVIGHGLDPAEVVDVAGHVTVFGEAP